MTSFDYVNIEIAKDPTTPEEELEKLSESESPDVLIALASNPKLPSSLFMKLYNVDDFRIREALAKNPSTPLEILEKLIFEGDSRSEEAGIVFNPSVSEELLLKVLDEKPELAYIVAQRPHPPKTVIERILNGNDSTAKIELALNLTVYENVLWLLYNDRNVYVKSTAVSNPNAPYEMIKDAVFHKNEIVRYGALRNPNLPEHLLFVLLYDEASWIREKAQSIITSKNSS
jgi:hypothetical protein